MEESKLYELTVKHWGETPQLLKTIEELGELSRAIARYLILTSGAPIAKEALHWNHDLSLMAIYHEMVDVEIMIAQIKQNFNRPAIYEHTREIKLRNLKRLLRLEGEDV